MNDIDELHVGVALRERLHTEQPDLEHLAAASLRAGLRLRRRRRAGTIAVGAAGVAAVAVAGSQLAGGGGSTARDAEPAASSTATPTPATTVTAAPDDAAGLPTGQPVLPVVLDAPGWTCESYAVDEKMSCTKGDLVISIVVRDAADHAQWAADPDKGGSSLWVSPVHGNYFVSVQGGAGLTAAELDAVIDGLSFADSWQRP